MVILPGATCSRVAPAGHWIYNRFERDFQEVTMPHLQRYVSKELTHFAAAACRKRDDSPDRDAQYQCLLKILAARG